MNSINRACRLVGPITEQDLQYVDYYVGRHIGLFIPSVGFCGYATRVNHSHPSHSFTILLSPEQKTIPTNLIPGEEEYLAAYLAPEIPHTEEKQEQFQRYIAIFIEPEYLDTLAAKLQIPLTAASSWQVFRYHKNLLASVNRLILEIDSEPVAPDYLLDALEAVIATDLLRSLSHKTEQDALRAPTITSGSIEGVIQYIQQYFGEPLDIAQLAALAHMSASGFSSAFRSETGVSPHQYIIRTRLEKACKLLRSGTKNITQTAIDCGFLNTPHFSHAFRKQYQMTPTEYQRQFNH